MRARQNRRTKNILNSIIENAHRKCCELLEPDFLLSHVDPISARWKRTKGRGLGYVIYDSKKIVIHTKMGIEELSKMRERTIGDLWRLDRWRTLVNTLRYVTAHETGHYLRRTSNQDAYALSQRDRKRVNLGNVEKGQGRFLDETIAEISALLFSQRVKMKIPYETVANFIEFQTAHHIVKEHGDESLKKMTAVPYEKAIEFVLEHKKPVKTYRSLTF